ncbi:ARM repeat-containing protein, partial [Aureobasidium melanogenum]
MPHSSGVSREGSPSLSISDKSQGTAEQTWTSSSLPSHQPFPRALPFPIRLAKESTLISPFGLSTTAPRGIFSFDVTANKSRLPLAKNALRKFRTLRHPGVIKVLDTVETDTYIYIATERITPLGWKTKRNAISEESIKWGLHNVAKTLAFINEEATSVHGCVRASSVFTTDSGEWKLGGLDVLSSMKEDEAVIYTYGSLTPDSGRYAPPEVAKGGWDSIKRSPVSAVDSYDFAILVIEVFNGGFSSNDQVGQTKGIPVNMHASYKRLAHANPKTRLSIAHFLEQGRKSGSFFDTPLIQLTDGIDNLGLKSETEREEFLRELEAVAEVDDFPEDFFRVKVLPELLKSLEFGGGGPKVLSLVMRIGKKLSDEEYEATITPVVVRLFSSPDRALRVCLLDNLPHMIDHLPQKIVNNGIYPQMVTGFTDLAPLVREQTVKAVLVVVPKLSDRIINGELLRYLAKTANDEQPGIRTNTTICLGKIAKNLGSSSRTKVLVAAFSRSLRDPFVHARNAALLALAATAELFSEDDCATKLLPAICPSLVDKEKIIRDQANKTLDLYLQRIRKYGQTLPDSVLPPPEAAGSNAPRMSTPQPGGAGAGAGWAGWAISSFTNKLATASGEIQPNSSAATTASSDRPSSTPPTTSSSPATQSLSAGHNRPTPTFSPSAPTVPRVSSGLRNATPTMSDVDQEDFGDDWGAMDDDDGAADAWGTVDDSAPPVATTKASTASFDDGGEPDFEGWLNAQAQAKTKAKNPLPKGLTKSKPSVTRSASASVATRTKPVAKPAPSKPHGDKYMQKTAALTGSAAASAAGATGTSGHGFFKASWILTRAPLGPATHPIVESAFTIDDNDSVSSINLENAHLLAGQNSATTTLRGTRTTHDSVSQGLTVTGGQARLVLDTELVEVAAETDLVGGKVPSLRPCHISGLLNTGADLDGPVAVLLTGLVGNDLHAIELEDCAGGAFCGLGVVEGGHALLDSEGSENEPGQLRLFPGFAMPLLRGMVIISRILMRRCVLHKSAYLSRRRRTSFIRLTTRARLFLSTEVLLSPNPSRGQRRIFSKRVIASCRRKPILSGRPRASIHASAITSDQAATQPPSFANFFASRSQYPTFGREDYSQEEVKKCAR